MKHLFVLALLVASVCQARPMQSVFIDAAVKLDECEKSLKHARNTTACEHADMFISKRVIPAYIELQKTDPNHASKVATYFYARLQNIKKLKLAVSV